ncbi:MAG: UDP-N-acetylmuramoyl-L-alanyl-D-glutamate--2,6-diaminopimelate ligase [Chloroflexota bacterium]|nr:UDP-N-acetylmuramoyl-L-alanyl-D-glutamate--2,6-diaminopimelate ligase [Chloroflexota bacterium]
MVSGDVLIRALPEATRHHWRPVEIQNVVCDSRQVRSGDLFVAIPGVSVDGHRFVPHALEAGAVACVVERMLPSLEHVPTVIVPNAREALAHLHAAYRGFPGRDLKVIGVTGTDGKTTTVRLTAAICRAAGHATGSVDSIAATIGEREVATGFHTTTPDAGEMQAYLAQMVAAGMEYVVIESTSHGLAQHRVTACEYDVAAVTNVTHEHLDYHGSYAAYRAAKRMLFEHLGVSFRKPGVDKVAVLNGDDPSYEYLRSVPADRQITYGLESGAQVTARDIVHSGAGLIFSLVMPGAAIPVRSSLIGRYNVPNILAAASVGYSQGFEGDAIREGIANVRAVPGRMESIDRGQPYTVIVDFAHTPNALEEALRAVRGLADGRITVVFGCAGLRYEAKRSWMGEIAGRLADRVVITAEDPRTESLEKIMEQIATGCRRSGRREGEGFWRIGDRGEAIGWALETAAPGDLILITGKGHEQSMCFGTTEHPWSDQKAVLKHLKQLGYE